MGIFDKFKIGFKKSASALTSGIKEIIIKKEIDDENLDKIEEFLIQSDVGVEAASEIKEIISTKKIDPKKDLSTEINLILKTYIISLMKPLENNSFFKKKDKLTATLISGVNGVGKTTTIGKIGKILKSNGNKVMFAASDTFRAAAIEQLENWAKKIDVQITKSSQGSDPASVAYKAVNESLQKPLDYYHNNIAGLITILNLCLKNNVNHFVFSSSATVYGSASAPLLETSPVGTGITNPYGQTKYMAETILQDVCNAHPQFQCTCLRYFNPVGAHPSGLLGENPKGIPTNLMPYIIRVAAKHNNIVDLGDAYHELTIFGGDYQTKDGTCIRDFIHVCDLAKAHVCSLRETQGGYQLYNVGTGLGTSVLELVETFQRVNQIQVPFTIKERREGDRDIVYCNASKIESVLGWKAEKSLKSDLYALRVLFALELLRLFKVSSCKAFMSVVSSFISLLSITINYH